MAANYDRDNNKRIWPEIIIPRSLIVKVAEMRHGGNTKKAVDELRGKFIEDDNSRLADCVAQVDAEYPAWKEADDKAKAAVPPPAPKPTAAEKKAAKEAAAAGTPAPDPVTATTEVIEE